MLRNRKISVTVVTGFLGAGKTTFINSVLKKYPETQFALVENEFGEVSIDTKLIKGVEASRMFELKQGCICCTISDEFELVLQELAERFPNVEHLLIETTGIADPAQVLQPFFTNEELKNIYQFNGTICIADALNFKRTPEKEILLKQLVVADLILISKSENLHEIQKENFAEMLKKINPFAEISFFNPANDKNLVLELNIRKKKTQFNFLRLRNLHSGISSKTLRFTAPLNKNDFLDWLGYTLDIYKNKIYRVKGILSFENEPFEYVLQGVGGSFEITEENLIQNEFDSEIVFIGKLENVNLDFQPE